MYIYAKSASYSRKSAYQNTPVNGVIFSLHIMHCLITRKQRDEILLYCVHTMLVCKFLAICLVTSKWRYILFAHHALFNYKKTKRRNFVILCTYNVSM